MAPLLHRDRELAVFREAIDELRIGRPTVATILGENGIGKSALLSAVTDLLPSRSLVLRARCHPSESRFAYGMVRQLFDPVLSAGGRPRRQFDRAATDDGVATYDLLTDLFHITRDLVAEQPVVIAIDDLSFADLPSLRWFSYIARRLDDLPVMMVATLREGAPSGPLAELSRLPYARFIQLRPICATCTADFVGQTLGAPPDEELSAFCHTLSQGNPRVLRELTTRMRHARVIPGLPDLDRVLEIGAAALSDTVLEWLHDDDAVASDLLTQLAVMGPDTDVDVAAMLSGQGELELQKARRTLVQAGLITAEPPVRFSSTLVRAAALSRLDTRTRLDLHERVAALLARMGAPAAQTAEHLMLTTSAWGVPVLRAAATEAVTARRYADAARYLRRALSCSDDPAVVHELTLQLGRTELHHDLDSCARHAEALVTGAPDTVQPSRSLLYLASPALAASTVGARPFVTVVQELATAPDPPRESLLRLGAQVLLSGHRAGLRRAARMAVTGAPDAASREFSGALAAMVAAGGRHPGTAGRLAARATLSSSHLGRSAGSGLVGAALAFAWTGQPEEAMATCSRILEHARAWQQPELRVLGLLIRSDVAYRRGDSADSLRDAIDARDGAERIGASALTAAARACGARALIQMGETQDATVLMREMTIPVDAHPLIKSLIREAQGMIAAAADDHVTALSLFLDCGQRLSARGVTNPTCLPWRAHAAKAYSALGEHAAARTIAAEPPAATGHAPDASHARVQGETRAQEPAQIQMHDRTQERTRGQILLTPAEQRVVELVRQGMSSLEVAERLCLSKRTIDTHLGRIYRKLGIRGRHQLAAALGV
ncbi:AAA family ATPase [Streptosporangium sp. NPDC023615]|uniref:AAA family ATPase n=1 Tax=Streptosporangium sp. NPDC023615 TaxID=3154794 RepID=UPI003449DA61